MRKLIFFSRKKEPLYLIEGNSILTDFAIFYLKKHKKKFYYSKKSLNINYQIYEKFYLPERFAKYFNNKHKQKINFTLITEDFVIPITNNYDKFKKRLKKIFSINELLNLESILNNDDNNLKKFSNNLLKILHSILAIYGFFSFDKIDNSRLITIIRDFFSNNFIFFNYFPENFNNLNNYSFKENKLIKVSDLPDKYKIKVSDSLVVNILNEVPLPESFIIYIDELIYFEKMDNYYIVKNCLDIHKLNKQIKLINPQIIIEKKFIKSYKGLISKNKNFIGRYATEPYNPYDLINSAWRYFNEKERIK